MKRPRRLLTIGHSYVVSMNRRLAHEMSRAGGEKWEVAAAAPEYFHGGNDLRPVSFQLQPDEPCPVFPIPSYSTRRVHLFSYHWQKLRQVLQRQWDVVHAWEEPYIIAGAEIAFGIPKSSRFVFRTAQSISKRYLPPFNFLEKFTLQRSSGWICSGRLVQNTLSQRKGYEGKPMARIPLGVDVESFRPNPPSREAIRQRLGWSIAGPPVVGYLGRFTREKGLELLMSSLNRLKTPWRALFVGSGQLDADLQAWAKTFSDDRVRICNSIVHDEVPPYLSAMDVMVAPSQTTPHWKEQFGRMLIEAMASGVPVMGSDSGEIPFVIGDAGVVLPESDPDAWTQGLAELLENPARRAEFSVQGREKALREFAWPIVARQHLNFFEMLTADSPNR